MLIIKRLIKIICYSLDNLALKLFGPFVLRHKDISVANFSIDDVVGLPRSVNSYLLKSLTFLHNRYGLIVHNYLFYKIGEDVVLSGFDKELNRLNWLNWGAHQEEFIGEIYQVINSCGMNKSQYIRLHEFKLLSDKTIPFLANEGVKGLLTADDKKRASYKLTKEEIAVLNRNGIAKANNTDEFIYLKSEFRLEKMIFPKLLSRKYHGGTLVFFTHENKYEQIEKRLILICKLLNRNRIKFI